MQRIIPIEEQLIPIEEQHELVRGFIQYAFDEMHTDDWTTRRKELREEFEIDLNGHVEDDQPKPTIPVMMEIYQNDLDKVLNVLFYREIMSYGWFEAYCIQLNPKWDKRNVDVYCYWTFESILNNWCYHKSQEAHENGLNVFYELKEVLGLNLSLK
jgi:hypothetical protein